MYNVTKSLLEELPNIVASGRKQAETILAALNGNNRLEFQTRELVIPRAIRIGGICFVL